MSTRVLEIGARNPVEVGGGTYDTGLPFEPEKVAAFLPKGCREVTRPCDVSGNTAAMPDSTAVAKVEVDTVRVEVCKDAGQTIRPVDMQLTPVYVNSVVRVVSVNACLRRGPGVAVAMSCAVDSVMLAVAGAVRLASAHVLIPVYHIAVEVFGEPPHVCDPT